jgi:hypothetical protein
VVRVPPPLSLACRMRLSRSAGCTVELSDDPFAASRNLDDDARVDQTRHYEALRAHYGITPTRNNTGVAHETRVTPSKVSTAFSSAVCCLTSLTAAPTSGASRPIGKTIVKVTEPYRFKNRIRRRDYRRM